MTLRVETELNYMQFAKLSLMTYAMHSVRLNMYLDSSQGMYFTKALDLSLTRTHTHKHKHKHTHPVSNN